MVRVYTWQGNIDETREIVNFLPSFEVGRELMILDRLHGMEKKAHYKNLIERFEHKIEQFRKRMDDCE